MAEGENKSWTLEVIAVIALLFLFWRMFSKRKVLSQTEPITTAPEVINANPLLDPYAGQPLNCDEGYIFKPLSPYGPDAADFTVGKGYCYKGDGSFFDGKDVSYGDKYADEQAAAFSEASQAQAVRNINKDVIQFKLINSTTAKAPVSVLDTVVAGTPVFNPSSTPNVPVAITASGVTSSGFTANWAASTGATGYYLDVATDSGFLSFVTGYNNLDVGDVSLKALIGLNADTNYYYRVRAYNNLGISDNSNVITLITTNEVLIGTQTWKIKNVSDNILGSRVYNDDETNRAIYGGLYLWSMIGDIESANPGFHVPTLIEWQTLIAYLGGALVSGGYLKESGFDHWNSPNTGANNSSGFTALGTGFFDSNYNFNKITSYIRVRDKTPGSLYINFLVLSKDNGGAYLQSGGADDDIYMTVRLIKD